MSYRKLEVDGNVFEYSIGKTHTKIRGVGAYENGEIGAYHSNYGPDSMNYPVRSFQVRPSDLAAFIKKII